MNGPLTSPWSSRLDQMISLNVFFCEWCIGEKPWPSGKVSCISHLGGLDTILTWTLQTPWPWLWLFISVDLSFSIFKLIVMITIPIKIRNITRLYYLDSESLWSNVRYRVTLLRFKSLYVFCWMTYNKLLNLGASILPFLKSDHRFVVRINYGNDEHLQMHFKRLLCFVAFGGGR